MAHTPYVALLRGINVGGKAKVDMRRLKTTFERLGLQNVRTYINSGNVVFTGGGKDRARLRRRIERAISDDFGLDVKVLLRDVDEMRAVAEALPSTWRNDKEQKCDVLFSDQFTSPDAVDRVPLAPGIEEAHYVPGAILYRVPREKQSKGKLNNVVGTDLYKQMTIRNVNTVRKLYQLLEDATA